MTLKKNSKQLKSVTSSRKFMVSLKIRGECRGRLTQNYYLNKKIKTFQKEFGVR